eukprot:7564783-Pyramimonas_sp.AAC.1
MRTSCSARPCCASIQTWQLGETTPVGTPRKGQATGSPAISPMAAPKTEQPGHRQSALEQQIFMQQQHQTAMSE